MSWSHRWPAAARRSGLASGSPRSCSILASPLWLRQPRRARAGTRGATTASGRPRDLRRARGRSSATTWPRSASSARAPGSGGGGRLRGRRGRARSWPVRSSPAGAPTVLGRPPATAGRTARGTAPRWRASSPPVRPPGSGLRGLAPARDDPADPGERADRRVRRRRPAPAMWPSSRPASGPRRRTGPNRRSSICRSPPTTDNPALRAAVAEAPRRRHRRGRGRRQPPRPRRPHALPGRYDGVVGVGAIGPDSAAGRLVPGRVLCGHRGARRRRWSARCPAAATPCYEGTQLRGPVRVGHGGADPGPLARTCTRPRWCAACSPRPTRPPVAARRTSTGTACSTRCAR